MTICITKFGDLRYDSRTLRGMRALRDMDHEVVAVGITDRGRSGTEEWEGMRFTRVRVSVGGWSKWKFLQYHWKAIGAVLRTKAQVVHAHDVYSLMVAGWAAVWSGAKLIYEARELFTEVSGLVDRPVERAIWGAVERMWINRSDQVITVSDGIAGMLSERYRIPRPVVIRNLPEYREVHRTSLLRERLGIPKERKIALYQGVLGTGRGLEGLIRVTEQVEKIDLVLLGDGPLRAELKTRAQNSPARERIHMLNAVPPDHLLEYTASADIGVHLIQNTCLNHYYCLPNKLFQYVLAGVPVIISNLPEIAKVVQAYDIGILVDPAHEGAVAQAMRRMAEEDELRKHYARHAQQAAPLLNWEQERAKLREAYEGIADCGLRIADCSPHHPKSEIRDPRSRSLG